jgi:hypothetical protein
MAVLAGTAVMAGTEVAVMAGMEAEVMAGTEVAVMAGIDIDNGRGTISGCEDSLHTQAFRFGEG